VVRSCSAVVVDVGSGSLLTYWWSLAGHRDSLPVKALQFLNHSLYVPSVSHEDEGLYQCHAQFNSSTFSSRNATLVIACKIS